jgi:hypothetical protein
MAFRFATTAGLALATALFATGASQAQNFFGFGSYELSPRQVAGVLSDDGYQLHGPITRRGDVYVCDAVSVSGRSVRLIVSARDGRVIDRYATGERRRYADDDNDGRSRAGSDWGWSRQQRYANDDEDSRPAAQAQPRDQLALGDVFGGTSRVYGNDMFAPKPAPTPAPTTDSVDPPKPKHHAAKKHHDSSPAVAKAPPSDAGTPVAEPSATPSPSVAAVAPSAPEKSAVEPSKPVSAPDVVKPMPTPEASAPTPSPKQTTAETDKPAAAEAPKPAPVTKSEGQRKKLNDLPVGTLD